MSRIHRCLSPIEQAAGLQLSPPAEVGDLAFKMCKIGGGMVSVEGLSKSIRQPVDRGLLDEPRWLTAKAWIRHEQMITIG